MKLNLPIHPTKRHPLTGEPLQAVYVRPDGRVFWPIMGGAPDGDAAGSSGGGDTGGDTGSGSTGDSGAGDSSGDAGAGSGDQGSGTDKDLGFPTGTPVAQMTVAQQAAYWQHQSRKHETRATEYRQAVGGKTAAEVQAELEQLRRDKMTADERAVDDAKRQARDEATREYAPKSVRAAFDLLLGDMPEAERNAEIELLDLSKFITSAGDVDTAKVRAHAEKIAPADKDKGGRRFDFGGGSRSGSGQSTGVSAGRQLFKERRGNTSTTTT